MRFRDRDEAGRLLAERLAALEGYPDLCVLALPRGGVPVALPIARRLRAPLDVFVVRKLGVPYQPELAFGALASGGVRVINAEVVHGCGLSDTQLREVEQSEAREIERREKLYRPGRKPLALEGKTVLVVDDGLATGATMRAALLAVRASAPREVWVAVPVGPRELVRELHQLADEVVCLSPDDDFIAVGLAYDDFSPVEDEEVCRLLALPGRGESPHPSR